MKKRLVGLAFFASMLILLLSQISLSGYVGDQATWFYTPQSTYSYVVGLFNSTHYFLQNHTGYGLAAYDGYEYMSTNASAVVISAMSSISDNQEISIVFKPGTYTFDSVITLSASSVDMVIDGQMSTFQTDSSFNGASIFFFHANNTRLDMENIIWELNSKTGVGCIATQSTGLYSIYKSTIRHMQVSELSQATAFDFKDAWSVSISDIYISALGYLCNGFNMTEDYIYQGDFTFNHVGGSRANDTSSLWNIADGGAEGMNNMNFINCYEYDTFASTVDPVRPAMYIGAGLDVVIDGMYCETQEFLRTPASGAGLLQVNNFYDTLTLGRTFLLQNGHTMMNNIKAYQVYLGGAGYNCTINNAELGYVWASTGAFIRINNNLNSSMTISRTGTPPGLVYIQNLVPIGYAATTPAFPANDTDVWNNNTYTVRITILTIGTNLNYTITDYAGTSQTIETTLIAGMQITLDPYCRIKFSFNVAPTWKWYGC